jgi:hypothetical protein
MDFIESFMQNATQAFAFRDLSKEHKNKKFLLVHQPVFPGNTCLPENPDNEIHADFCTMWIWEGENEIATDHVRVLPTMKRTIKTKSL